MHIGFDFLLFFHTALVPFLAVRDLVLLWYIELQDRGAGLFWLLMLFYWWFVCFFFPSGRGKNKCLSRSSWQIFSQRGLIVDII